MRKDLNGMMNEINANIINEKAKLAAWQKVEIGTKKDGSDFQNLTRGVKNATIKKDYEKSDYENTYLKIWYRGHEYGEDSIRIFGYQEDLPDNDKRKTKSLKSGYMKTTYTFNSTEIKEKIKQEITSIENRIKSLEKEKENIEDVYNEIYEAALSVHEIMKQYKNSASWWNLTEMANDIMKYGK